MKKIAFINQKGGVGKTTLLINIAFALSKNKNVFILDTDPQASCCQFLDSREENNLPNIDYASCSIGGLKKAISSIDNHDVVLIDTMGSGSADILKSLENIDYVIVPMQTSQIDLNSTATFIKAVRAYGIQTPLSILINGATPQSLSIVEELKSYFNASNIDVFNNYICNRKPYKDSMFENKTILEYLTSSTDVTLVEFNKVIKEFMKKTGV